MKIIKFGKQARESVRKGINLAVDCVKVTLGPNGENAGLARLSITPEITNDGATVLQAVEAEDETEQMGVEWAKEAARLTEISAGDGTTTTTILLGEIVNACLGKIDKDVLVKGADQNKMEIKRQVDEACKRIVDELKKQAKQISKREDILKVAMVSVENEKLAEIITDIYLEIGKDGTIVVEEGLIETKHESVKGMEINTGLVSDVFYSKTGGFQALNPHILVTSEVIKTKESIANIVQQLVYNNFYELVIFARDFDDSVLESFKSNHLDGIVSIVPIRTSSPDQTQLDDIAAFTGAKMLKDINLIQINDLGRAKNFMSTKDKTMILDGAGNATEQIEKLKKEYSESKSEFDKERLQRRIACLSGGIAVIKVGASSQTEREYLKRKVDDAVLAVKYALQDGVVNGGGLALYKISENEEIAGILKDIIKKPYLQLKENGVINISEDIIDPVRVTIESLKNACSVGSMIITMGVTIANEKQRTKE